MPVSQVCDVDNDCGDRTDEANCPEGEVGDPSNTKDGEQGHIVSSCTRQLAKRELGCSETGPLGRTDGMVN